MFSTDFIFGQQENLVDNQKCQAGFRPLCNKILLLYANKHDGGFGKIILLGLISFLITLVKKTCLELRKFKKC